MKLTDRKSMTFDSHPSLIYLSFMLLYLSYHEDYGSMATMLLGKWNLIKI